MPRTRPHDITDLLVELTRKSDSFAVSKRWSSAIQGLGDIDAVAPMRAWSCLKDVIQTWASTHSFDNTIVCRHYPGVLHAIVASDTEVELEIDLCAVQSYRGAPLLTPESVRWFARLDERGFRRLPPGAEIFQFLLTGSSLTGQPKPKALARRRVRAGLIADPTGAEAAARSISWADHSLRYRSERLLRRRMGPAGQY